MNEDRKMMSLVYNKLEKEDKRISNLQKIEKVSNSFFRELIAFCIILYCGKMVQKEIIKQIPELEEEIRRQNQKAFVYAIFITLLIGFLIWRLSL